MTRRLAWWLLWLAGCEPPQGLPLGSRAGECAPCHAEIHEAWSASRHGQSGGSPVFQALLPHVERSWGLTSRERCVACHQPGHGGDASVGCVSCHGAVGNRGEFNGALEIDLDAPLAGPSPAAHQDAHRTAPRPLLTSASLCGTCHEVHGPGLLEEPTLTEYRASPFAAEDSCLSCHRTPGPDLHRFLGVDPPWGAPPAEAARAAEESRKLWARALHMEVIYKSGKTLVRLENRGAGHAVPTGVVFLRDVWVDAFWEDAAGTRFEVPRLMELGALLERGGQPVALVTDADRVTPRGLAPGEGREVEVPGPQGARAPLRLVATLKARAVRASAMSALGLEREDAQVPELHIATAR